MPKRREEYPENEHTFVNLTEEDNINHMREELSHMRKKINELCEENEYLSIKQNQFRARSITVGTAFGGIPEVVLRADGATVHAQMQPTEVVELIEQLAAGIGVEIAMRPKQNFASWRGWEEVIQQRVGFHKIQWKGAAAWQLNGGEVEEKYRYLTGDYVRGLEGENLDMERARLLETDPDLLPPDEYMKALAQKEKRQLMAQQEEELLKLKESKQSKSKRQPRKKKVNGDSNE